VIPGRHRQLTVIQQGVALKKAQPNSHLLYPGRNNLIWRGTVQPTLLSIAYEIEISYQYLYQPKTRVLRPILETRNGQIIPHMYGQKYLCLYRPEYREWSSSMCIADVIVPWASLWLFYYEAWLATGEWKGGGEHPSDHDKNRSLRRHDRVQKENGLARKMSPNAF
jgi:hypothetical protein